MRAQGVETIILFGSSARDEGTDTSDVDLAIRPSAGFSSGGFDHFGRLEDLRERLAALLHCDNDLVEEPAVRSAWIARRLTPTAAPATQFSAASNV
ncbi:MAG: nucleotidyltransferase domain-containing protein [Acetobacteraceae bacterium]